MLSCTAPVTVAMGPPSSPVFWLYCAGALHLCEKGGVVHRKSGHCVFSSFLYELFSCIAANEIRMESRHAVWDDLWFECLNKYYIHIFILASFWKMVWNIETTWLWLLKYADLWSNSFVVVEYIKQWLTVMLYLSLSFAEYSFPFIKTHYCYFVLSPPSY